jgi:hypothetical protein
LLVGFDLNRIIGLKVYSTIPVTIRVTFRDWGFIELVRRRWYRQFCEQVFNLSKKFHLWTASSAGRRPKSKPLWPSNHPTGRIIRIHWKIARLGT